MNAQDLLTKLGSTADEIASTLQSMDVKGRRGNFHSCPLFNYLTGQGKKVWLVGQCRISLSDESVSTSDACADFIRAFDGGNYPNLVRL